MTVGRSSFLDTSRSDSAVMRFIRVFSCLSGQIKFDRSADDVNDRFERVQCGVGHWVNHLCLAQLFFAALTIIVGQQLIMTDGNFVLKFAIRLDQATADSGSA